MEQILNSVIASLDSENWLAALFLALAIPDICASIETPERPVGERYKDWFNRYLQHKYQPPQSWGPDPRSSPAFLAKIPIEFAEILTRNGGMGPTVFTAEDCYRLRCRCLHQALSERTEGERIHFTAPDQANGSHHHLNWTNGVLQVCVDTFCRDVVIAARVWWSTVSSDESITARARQLIKVHSIYAPIRKK